MKKQLFIAGLIVGAIGAWIVKPKADAPIASTSSVSENRERRTFRSVGDLLEDCRTATTHRQQHRAYQNLARGARQNYGEALELAGINEHQNALNKEVAAILSAWADSNPKAALEWSWQNLRQSARWEIAMEEIMETWIASGDPAVLDFLESTPLLDDPLTVEESDGEQPLFLHQEEMMHIKEWLYFYDSRIARAAWERGIGPLLQWPPPPDFIERLKTPEEIESAARIWHEEPIEEFTLAKILSRAHELKISLPDSITGKKLWSPPASSPSQPKTPANKAFAKAADQRKFWVSAREDLAQALRNAATLDTSARQAAYLTMYDSWALAHPGEEPDYASLPPEARAVWRDLAVIGPVNDPLTSSSYSR